MVGWLWRLVDWLWPARCVACRATGDWWCYDCDAKVVRITAPSCPGCNRLTPIGQCCAACRRKTALTGVLAGAHYREPLRTAIAALKYRHATAIAPRLAAFQLLALARLPGLPVAVLIPVPLHRSRRRRRGHNQAELLAKPIGQVTGIPLRPGLVRTRRTRSQTGLSRRQRQSNVERAFRWTGPPLTGQTAILVDDVLTTGATLAAAAAPLRAAGARQVWGLVVAKR